MSEATGKSVPITSKPVRPYVPDGTEITLADGLYVTFDQGNFVLSFVQLEHPLVTGADDAAAITEVRSRCVGRFAISPERMLAMVDTLQGYLRRVTERHAEGAEDESKAESTTTEQPT